LPEKPAHNPSRVAPFVGKVSAFLRRKLTGYNPDMNGLGINAALYKGNPRWNGGRNKNKQTQ